MSKVGEIVKFYRETACFTALFLALFSCTLFWVFSYGQADIRDWQKMQTKSQKVKNREYVARQDRKGVRKDVVQSDRLKIQLEGESSRLLLDNRKDGEGLCETLAQVFCVMQDMTSLTVRTFSADAAKYRNKEGVFEAADVEVKRFREPAFPMMEGLAKTVQFSLCEKNINFKARGLHATLYKD